MIAASFESPSSSSPRQSRNDDIVVVEDTRSPSFVFVTPPTASSIRRGGGLTGSSSNRIISNRRRGVAPAITTLVDDAASTHTNGTNRTGLSSSKRGSSVGLDELLIDDDDDEQQIQNQQRRQRRFKKDRQQSPPKSMARQHPLPPVPIIVTSPKAITTNNTPRHHHHSVHHTFLGVGGYSPPGSSSFNGSVSPFCNNNKTLFELCTDQMWREACIRCRTYPKEAYPTLYDSDDGNAILLNENTINTPSFASSPTNHQPRHSPCFYTVTSGLINNKSPSSHTNINNNNKNNKNITTTAPLYNLTPLGIVCKTNFDNKDEMVHHRMVRLVTTLLDACPDQVQCSQQIFGNTPLRDAVRNNSFTATMLRPLLEADNNNNIKMHKKMMISSTPLSGITTMSSNKSSTCWASTSTTATTTRSAILCPDKDGIYPIDHLIMGVHVGIPEYSTEMLKVVIEVCPFSVIESKGIDNSSGDLPIVTSSSSSSSPLIKLLSMGTSFGLNKKLTTIPSVSSDRRCHGRRIRRRSRNNNSRKPASRMVRIVECVKAMLSSTMSNISVSLINSCSQTSQCTPLHIALRNYGDCMPLIELLLEKDINHHMVQTRNMYGDLPIHVACSVGVPIEVLKIVLEHTEKSTTMTKTATLHKMPEVMDNPHPLIWSGNESGYTPIDLEWMRHIEGGRGFYDIRSFYPLEASGIRNTCRIQDKFYRSLLQEAVDNVFVNNSSHDDVGVDQQQNERILTKQQQVKMVVGALLDRIILIMNVSYSNIFMAAEKTTNNEQEEQETKNDYYSKDMKYLLHVASALSRVPGYCLPSPLLQLFLWMKPNEVCEKDSMGRLPLHHALMPPFSSSYIDNGNMMTIRREVAEEDETSWIKVLMDRYPRAASLADNSMRLPLHYALVACRNSRAGLSSGVDNDCDGRDRSIKRSTSNDDSKQQKTDNTWEEVICSLIELYPEATDRRDPITRLYPFMLAAIDNTASSLDVVYNLLRRSPTRIQGV